MRPNAVVMCVRIEVDIVVVEVSYKLQTHVIDKSYRFQMIENLSDLVERTIYSELERLENIDREFEKIYAFKDKSFLIEDK